VAIKIAEQKHRFHGTENSHGSFTVFMNHGPVRGVNLESCV